MIKSILATYFPICFLFVSCGGGSASFSGDERREAESIVRAVRGSDSLAVLQKRLEGEGNRLGSVVALRELGRRLRNESRFEEALAAADALGGRCGAVVNPGWVPWRSLKARALDALGKATARRCSAT